MREISAPPHLPKPFAPEGLRLLSFRCGNFLWTGVLARAAGEGPACELGTCEEGGVSAWVDQPQMKGMCGHSD